VPYDPEREFGAASYRTKQLVVLAADLVLELLSPADGGTDVAINRAVGWGILPSCYRTRYDGQFLVAFRGATELTRNLLVSDAPFLPHTACELAAHAIFRHAEKLVACGSRGSLAQASAIDAALPEQLVRHRDHLARELEALKCSVLEDWDALLLFELPAGDDPVAGLHARLRQEERLALRFENWHVPFGSVPRPHITYDARAWPVALRA
jgi:hypothetical protein